MCRPAARVSGPRSALALPVLAALALAGCDGDGADVQISGVELRPEYSLSLLRPGAVALEPHNAPLPEMAPAEVANLFLLPEGLPQALDLPTVAPGGWARAEHGRLLRFAILFNATRPADGDALCAARAPIAGGPPQRSAYSAIVALCLRGEALAQGRIKARLSGELTPEWVSRTLGDLLSAMLGRSAKT